MIIPENRKPLIKIVNNDGTLEYRFVLRQKVPHPIVGFVGTGEPTTKANYLTMYRYGLDIAYACMLQILQTQVNRPILDTHSTVA